MKVKALDVLVCPACKSTLELTTQEQDGAEVLSGQLNCLRCNASYAIVRGIPRFVSAESYASSFGPQWNWGRKVQLDSMNGTTESNRALRAASGWGDSDFAGALVLDAGVGAGRFAEVAASKGAEVYGIDLSSAVEAAYRNIGRLENVHIVQADIFAMPFRAQTFDLAYSIGVLHHTPDPRAAFRHVSNTVKAGGDFAVYLYHRYGIYHVCSDLWRTVTTRLPLGVMAVLTAASVPLYYVYKVPLLGKVLSVLFPISHNETWRDRWLDTFDWYTPKYQWKFLNPDVLRWFNETGFQDVVIFDEPIRMRGTKAAQDNQLAFPRVKESANQDQVAARSATA